MSAEILNASTATGLFARVICVLALVMLVIACGSDQYAEESSPIPIAIAPTSAPSPASLEPISTPTATAPTTTPAVHAHIPGTTVPTRTPTIVARILVQTTPTPPIPGTAELAIAPEPTSPRQEVTPEPPPLTTGYTIYDPGFATLDEQILRAEIIARVGIRSVSAYVYTPAEGYHKAMIRFSFDALEYLKGSGNSILDVDLALIWEDYSSSEAALDSANEWIADNAERWPSGKEAVVFIQADAYPKRNADNGVTGQASSPIYKFVPLNVDENRPKWNYAYGIDYWKDTFSILSERNRTLLPAASAPAGATGASEARFLLGDEPEGLESHSASGASGSSGFATDISLSGLKTRVKAMADLVKAGKGIDGYEECLLRKYGWERIPYFPHSIDDIFLQSGLPAGTEIDSGTSWAPDEPDLYFITDGDAQFFEALAEDDDDDSNTGYNRIVRIARPLPNGAYAFEYHIMPGIFERCNFTPDYVDMVPASYWTISVTAPAGVLHEAFFDPASFGGVVGASVSGDKAGVLKPAEFKHDGANAALQQIEWSPDLNRVTLKIANPSVSLAGYHIDFIELDARVSLRLDFDDAETALTGYGQTLIWEVCRQPWHPGDLLMLRIAQSAGANSVTVKPVCAADPPGQATPTPAITPTPIPMR